MKLTSVLFISFSVVVSAFGVNPSRSLAKTTSKSTLVKPAFRKNSAAVSPLFRDPSKIQGGAVPGWAAYEKALDDKPLITKAMTSLVGWALGDLIAQVGAASTSLVDSFLTNEPGLFTLTLGFFSASIVFHRWKPL
jgi:hypothetical protein